jgi:hypothetical protein
VDEPDITPTTGTVRTQPEKIHPMARQLRVGKRISIAEEMKVEEEWVRGRKNSTTTGEGGDRGRGS